MPEIKQRRARWTTNAALCAVLASSLVTSGCLFGKKKKVVRVFVPPPVPAKVPPSSNPPVVTESLPDPVAQSEGAAPAIPLATLPPAPARPTPPAKPAAPKPPVVVEAPPAPAPKPITIFSAEERRQLNQELDERLDRVRRALARVEGRSLSAELIALANNARAFLQQAEQARTQDLVTAVNLAKRADLFATDLVSRLP
ncbi:MAG: hypothetical protein RL328_2606 [Acidobacteriota bacterium]|jgi:hypothetical protein